MTGNSSVANEAAPGRPSVADGSQITCSRNFGAWLARHRASLAFTSYQSGQLFLVGRLGESEVSFHQRDFLRAMGLWHQDGELYLASMLQIWRLANVLAPNERANDHFDRLFVPRTAHVTGDVDALLNCAG